MTKQLKADFALLMVTVAWGLAYIFIDLSLTEMGPFMLNTYRFCGAFAVAWLFAFPRMRKVSRATIGYSALMGFLLLLVYMGATFGVMYTSLSNSGFLCALTVIFTPILAAVFQKKRIEGKFAVVLVMTLFGIGLLTLGGDFRPASGDLYCIGCALAYAVDLLITEKAVLREDVDAFQLGVYQLGFTGLFNLLAVLLFEEPALPQTPQVWGAVLFLMIFCTGAAFIAQTVAQKYTSASRVGVIFTMEPVFAGAAAYFFAGEVLQPQGYMGAILLIAGLFLMEIDFKKDRLQAG